MSTRTVASRFAHLVGGRARAAEDDKDDKDKEAKSKSKAEEDDDKKDDDKEAKGKSKADESDDEDDDNSASDGDDDSDKDDEKDKDAKAVRARERGRCAAIFSHPAAAANPAAAAELAFGTSMSRKEARRVLGTLASTQAPAPDNKPSGRLTIDQRMSKVQTPAIGGDAAEGGERPRDRLLRAAKGVGKA